jgi:hypothetical protein
VYHSCGYGKGDSSAAASNGVKTPVFISMETFFLLILTSFQPLYIECNKIVRKQCEQYKVPVLFLFNGKLPDGYTLKPDERNLNIDEAIPGMFLKFKAALKEIYDVRTPDYILRCNATTFINFKKLHYMFSKLPKENCVAGPLIFATNYPELDAYCQGTSIILTKDVAKRLAYDANENDPCIYKYADDLSIDILTRSYAYKYDTTLFTARMEGLSVIPKSYDLNIQAPHVFFRIKNDFANRFEIDYELWKILHHLFDIIHYRNDFMQ